MEDILVFKDFLIAIALGALIGMEREMDLWEMHASGFAGIRTFILITLFGAVTAYVSKLYNIQGIFISAALFGFILLVVSSYIMNSVLYKKIGATTEMTALLAFILGMMCMLDLTRLAVSITILITIFLALKKILHSMAHKINRRELYSTLEFLLVTLVVLPFLPNQGYGPFEAFNPYLIWLMVVFVSAISYIGYIFMKWKGVEKGIGITGLIGGLVSSTSVAVKMAAESRKTNTAKPFAFATLLSSTTMFVRVLFIVFILNQGLIQKLIVPLGAMFLTAATFVLISKNSTHKPPKLDIKSPLSLAPALKFALFFAVVLFISKAAQYYYGNSGLYVVALLAGLADLNAITVSLATFSLASLITPETAVIGITLAVISDSLTKIWIGYLFGTKEFSRKVSAAYLIILIIGIAAIFFI